MGVLPKQNGHPVPSKDIGFNDQEILYIKEACDVRAQYSTLFPLSSNQNYQTERYTRSRCSSYPPAAQQTLRTDLPWMRPTGYRCSQLDFTQDARPEHGVYSGMDYMPISQSILCALPGHPCRRFRAFSSLSTGHPSNGSIRLPAMSIYDCFGGRPAFGAELENGQSHRQILSGTRVRATRSNRFAYPCCGRDLHPQRASLSNHRTGLSQRSSRLCRQGSQSRDARTLFQSAGCRTTQRHQGRGNGYVGPIHQGR
jgi:hypothetical protein